MDPETSARNLLEQMLLDGTAEPIDLPLSLLKAITNNFSDDQIIGRGRFSSVFKGLLQNGMIAVKLLSPSVNIDDSRFNHVVNHLMRVKHKNIVRFLGYCSDTQVEALYFKGKKVKTEKLQRLLCFEYIPGGSLTDHITDVSLGLEWKMQYQIIRGICEGLHHLHDKRIVHLDLKPENIWLDYNMVPKIWHIDESRFFDEGQTGEITENFVGLSFEYLAPEMLNTGVITFKSDIYALGITIAEILTGEKQYSSIVNVPEGWRNRLGTSGEDTLLEQIRVCAEICIRCQDNNPEKRPAIQRIIKALDETESMTPDAQRIIEMLNKDKFEGLIEELVNLARMDIFLSAEEPSNGVQQSTPTISGVESSERIIKALDEMESMTPDEQCLIDMLNEDKFEYLSDELINFASMDILLPAEEPSNGVQQSTPTISGGESSEVFRFKKRKKESSEIMELNILERIVAGLEEPNHLDLPLLYSVTESFSENRRIGQGGCGEVYKGILRNGDVAVKKLFNNRTIKDKMFHREVTSLITVRHQNIVRLLGYCSYTEERVTPFNGKTCMAQVRERLLCFEYISNGSLDRHLTDELRGLEWRTRFDIIVGICNGLCYLHKEKNIIHMDLKPANILVDDRMVPKITDFGLSRLHNNPQATTTTSRLISPGYSAPEYCSEGKSSLKSDIYSLGVIILELVSGSKNNRNITKVSNSFV